ncbi:MAG: Glu-tRNA(Gln) amidotransferase subunit GatE [Candidatus Aenigmarchaeota archaeon]|nr:Glu-tRNA(Gln) amidotransferase subunit GatE [Candidatus Aenigmarchaeota archaeon]
MLEEKINYKKIGLKAGLEIHLQLDTRNKLFCNCSTAIKEREPMMVIKRKQHVVQSELLETDLAAQYEFMRNRTFYYQVFPKEVCLICCDEEPPLPLNQEALEIAIQIALLLNCSLVEEIHVMRKTVIDGSTPMGFQRTMVIGKDGFIKYKGKKIPITHVSLEEDAAAIVKEENGNVTYRLNRLGVPLVEIGTGLLVNFSPKEIEEIAYLIGITCKSTGKIKKGIGAIRQDLNVSIKKDERVEIKGVQELGLLAKVIELEVKRQLALPKVEKETRAALPDGTTKYLRPLPGAARLYPETDVVPVTISKELVEKIKKELPEPWTKKLSRFKSKLKLSDDLAKQILRSDYLELFEKIVEREKVRPPVVANTFVNTLKDLEKREGVEAENLSEKHFIELFKALAKKKIVKEAIPEILKYLAKKPSDTVSNAIKELNLKPIRISELNKIVKEVITPGMSFEKAVGIVMSKVRGRIDAEVVMKVVKEAMK